MSFSKLPNNLPVPIDDGAARHLQGMTLPNVSLKATNGNLINIGYITGFVVIYIYPMTGRPGVPLPDGWEAIPGARGCTPQSCSFRDHYTELQQWQVKLYGLSTQTTDYQLEAKHRLHLPFELLSDSSLKLKSLISLPTFKVADMELYKRLTIIAKCSKVEKVFYPVFPPDQNADQVLSWFQENA
ncbi:MAG: peroxiredoxin [Symploca sp. SIO3C6]|nr:peroxiredoxin [Symploca sp. SIO3C6]